MNKNLTVARENALLGNYEAAIEYYKEIFSTVDEYAKRYDDSNQSQQGATTEFYFKENWNKFKRDIKNEYDDVV